jgi:hypothetical protein
MVEYALLLATSSFGSFSSLATGVFANVNWGALSYLLLALVALRIAFWAFRSES